MNNDSRNKHYGSHSLFTLAQKSHIQKGQTDIQPEVSKEE